MKLLVVDDHPLIVHALRRCCPTSTPISRCCARTIATRRSPCSRAIRIARSCCSTSRCPARTGSTCWPSCAAISRDCPSSCCRRRTIARRSVRARGRRARLHRQDRASATTCSTPCAPCSPAASTSRATSRPTGRAMIDGVPRRRARASRSGKAKSCCCSRRASRTSSSAATCACPKGTVKVHVSAILKALNVHSRSQVIVELARRGISLEHGLRSSDARSSSSLPRAAVGRDVPLPPLAPAIARARPRATRSRSCTRAGIAPRCRCCSAPRCCASCCGDRRRPRWSPYGSR